MKQVVSKCSIQINVSEIVKSNLKTMSATIKLEKCIPSVTNNNYDTAVYTKAIYNYKHETWVQPINLTLPNAMVLRKEIRLS